MQKQKRSLLKVGELARLTQVSTRTIRFYVEEGLLPKPVKTHRNMAYYDAGCIPKIKAIKKAQTERYLPLEVIGRMLAESGHDFSVLEGASPPTGIVRRPAPAENWPQALLGDLQRRRWISSQRAARLSAGDRQLAGFFATCRQLGYGQEALMEAFASIERLVENAVQVEFRSFFSRPDRIPAGELSRFFEQEWQVVKGFVSAVRERALKEALTRQNRTLDSAVLAVGDEGYGIPLSVIEDDLKAMQALARRRGSEARVLIDLATGYSCAGDQQKAMGFLRRALRRDPANIAARVRWCWYNRFSAEAKAPLRWRDRLKELVQANPGDIAGRVFLAIWYAFDSTEAADNLGSLQLINLCLGELKSAAGTPPANPHDWTLLHYAEGLVYSYILASLDKREKGLRAFEKILSRQDELETYYATRMPFFPKWLWPNLLFFYGLALIQTGDGRRGADALGRARAFEVSPLFRQRLEICLRCAEDCTLPEPIRPAMKGR